MNKKKIKTKKTTKSIYLLYNFCIIPISSYLFFYVQTQQKKERIFILFFSLFLDVSLSLVSCVCVNVRVYIDVERRMSLLQKYIYVKLFRNVALCNH